MRKRFGMLLVLMLTVAMLTITAQAAGFDSVADDLNALGVFKGTPSGYDLDRAPTRPEAATMLVRLLGKEAEAAEAYAAGEIAHPFTDVADWAAPYVAYLYENGLTKGMSETRFGSEELCSAQMYSTFALRALGYSDAAEGDFTYADAVAFAESKGVADMFLTSGEFTRGQLAGMSYQALAADVKGGESTLLAKLAGEGAIDAEAAQPMLDKIDAYKKYAAASSGSFEGKTGGIDMNMDMTMDISMPAAGINGTMNMDFGVQAVLSETDLGMAFEMDLEEDTELGIPALSMGMWMKDGVVYLDDGESKIKMDISAELGEGYADLLKEAIAASKENTAPVSGFYMLGDFSAKEADDGTVYTMNYGDKLADIYELVYAAMGIDGVTEMMSVDGMTVEVLVDKKGVLKSMDMAMTMKMDLGEIEGVASEMIYDVICRCDIVAMGEDVEIDYPDFTDFVDISTLPEVTPEPEPAAGGEAA